MITLDRLANVLGTISIELVSEVLLGVLEVFPGALGADLEATLGIRSPAVESPIEEVVWVRIVDGLNAVVSRAVQPALALESLGPPARLPVVREDVETGVHRQEVEQGHQRDGNVVLSHLPDGQVPMERSLPDAGVSRLRKVELIIARQAMISDHSLESALHVRHYL